MNIQNLQGYCLIYHDTKEIPEGLSSAMSVQRWEQWQALTPLVIYPTIEALIEATPDFNKKKHIIGQTITHLIGERCEVVTIPD